MNRLFPLAFALLLTSSPACAGRRPAQPALVEDALAWAERDRTKSIRLLEDAISSGETGEDDQPWVMLHLGEQYRLDGNTDKANEWFTRVLRDTTKNKALDGARLGLALLSPDESAARDQMRSIKEKFVPATINADRFLLLALEAIEAKDAGGTRTYTKKAMTWAEEDPAVSERVKRTLRTATGTTDTTDGGDTDTGDTGDTDTGDTGDGAEQMSVLDQARLAFQEGRSSEAKQLLGKVKADEGNQAAIDYLGKMIERGTKVKPNKVAVILPLEGKYAAAGGQVRDALEFGYDRGNGKAEMEFIDSGATAETAVAALEKAVIEGGAGLVVGPLLTPETEAFVAAAEALGVPTLSLSGALEDDPDRKWTVGGMVTAEQEVRGLLDYVMGEKEMKKFAIFAPDNNYGKRAAETFRAQAEERGGVITIETFYDDEATDLIPFAKELGQKDYEERWREIKDLRKAAEDAGRDPRKVVLPPKIDFDALFLPDKHRRVPIACAALAFEEFPLGEFIPVKDGPVIPLLGLSKWHEPELVGAGGEYTRNSFFTDSFAEYGTLSMRWAEDFRAEVGHSPSSREAASADVGRIVAALTKGDAKNWFEQRHNLYALDLDPGETATGANKVDAEANTVTRDIRILSIDRESVLQVHPEPVYIKEPVCEPDADGNLPEGCDDEETDGTPVPG